MTGKEWFHTFLGFLGMIVSFVFLGLMAVVSFVGLISWIGKS